MNTELLTIIVTFNGMTWIDRCMSSVQNSSVHSDIFVLDNGSTDGTVSYIRDRYPDTVIVESPTNLYFGGGNNEGFRFAIENDYKYVYLLNQDAWVLPDTFEILISVFEKNSGFAILSPMQETPEMDCFEWYFADCVVGRNYLNTLYQDCYFQREKEVYETGFVMAAHWMLPVSVVQKIGGFSPSFPQYGEDDNYCQRCRFQGYKIGIVPSAQSVHDSYRPDLPIKRKRTHMQYIGYVSDYSNVFERSRYPLLQSFIQMCSLAIHNRSLSPVCAYLKFLANLPVLRKNYKLSRTEGAFL